MKREERYLLERFLDGLCTEEEIQKVNILLDTPGGQALLDELFSQRETAAWNASLEENSSMIEFVRQKQQEMQQRISIYESGKRYEERRPGTGWNIPFRYAAIWAGLILLSGLCLWKFGKKGIFESSEDNYVEKVNLAGIPKRYALPDSSVVYLAGGSRIKYLDTYPETGRDVELKGEAFFEVKHDERHPFSIRSGKMLTRVLGTSFKVSSFEGQSQEVAVATGKVGISAMDKESTQGLALLSPGQKITFDPVTGKAVQGKVDIRTLEEWKTGELVFDDMEMGFVATALERRYGVRFHFANSSMAKHIVSGTFSASEPLPEVLNMLALVGKFDYSVSKDSKLFTIR